MTALGHDARRLTIAMACALAFMGASAGPASAAAPLAIFAANSEVSDTVEVLVIGPPNSQVAIIEESPFPGLKATVTTSGPIAPGYGSVLLQGSAIAANCDNRERRFIATVVGQSGITAARSEVLTPSCRKRTNPPTNPANVAIYGDSIMSQVVTPLEDLLPIYAKLDRTLGGGAGLTGFDFVGKAQQRTAAVNPQVSIVLLGGGESTCCSGNFTGRVRAMYDATTSRGGRVVWVLNPTPRPPVPPDPDKVTLINNVNAAVRATLAGLPRVTIVDLGSTMSPGGVFNQAWRAEDGLHFNIAGSKLAAQTVYPAVGALTQPGGGVLGVTATPKFTSGSPGTVSVSKSGGFTVKKPKVACTGTGGNCSVTTSVTASVKVGKKKKSKKIGSSRFTLKTGATGSVKGKLTSAGRKELKRVRRLRAKLKITVTRGSKSASKTVTMTLKAPKK